MNENAPQAYRGLDRFVARKKVVGEMEALGLLEKVEPHRHTVPFGDRGNVPIEPWLTEQWYVDAATLAKPAIAAVEDGRTAFVPKNWENTFFDWLRNIQPWCISRQLWWGHQIPAWYGPDGEIFVEMDEAAAKAAAQAHYGKAVELERDPDVLDTWFSSALWPFSTLGWPEITPELDRYYPTSLLVTGFDIIFFWVARMMMMGLHFLDEVPFDTVYIHALVRDAKGQKMSKSKGNNIDPLELIDKFGADALRFTLASQAAQGRDVKLSESRVEGNRNFATKLWNAARFCEMNDCRSDPAFDPGAVDLALNRWIVGSVTSAFDDVTRGLDSYKFNEAANSAYHFVWGTYCDWYLEFAKPFLQGDEGAARAETRATAGWALEQILILLHPFMPFVTEELWQRPEAARAAALIRTTWPVLGEELVDAAAQAELDWVIRLISEIRSVRTEMNVPPGARIDMRLQGAAVATLARLGEYNEVIRRLARLESAEPLDGAMPEGAVQAVVDEATVVLPLAQVIDLGAERARLGREIEKIETVIERLAAKLANENFTARAPAAVVGAERDKKIDAEQTCARLRDALARLP